MSKSRKDMTDAQVAKRRRNVSLNSQLRRIVTSRMREKYPDDWNTFWAIECAKLGVVPKNYAQATGHKIYTLRAQLHHLKGDNEILKKVYEG
jgi:hypothetical protein